MDEIKLDISIEESLRAREAGRVKSRELAADPEVQAEAARIRKRLQENSGLIGVDSNAQTDVLAFRLKHKK